MNKSSISLPIDESETLSVSYLPSDTVNKRVTWSSSNTNVATVSNGVITAKSVGTATISATAYGNSNAKATCTVNVTGIKPTQVIVDPFIFSIKVGQTKALTATVLPENATNKDVTWTTAHPEIATVSANGVVTGKAPGFVNISAWAESRGGNSYVSVIDSTCPSLENQITLPANLKLIESSAFEGMNSINKVVLPKGLERIENRAFADNPCLTTIYIPNSVTYIAEDAFQNDKSIMFYCELDSYCGRYADRHGIFWWGWIPE